MLNEVVSMMKNSGLSLNDGESQFCRLKTSKVNVMRSFILKSRPVSALKSYHELSSFALVKQKMILRSLSSVQRAMIDVG